MDVRLILFLIFANCACWLAPVFGAGSPFYEIQVIARRGSVLADGRPLVPNIFQWYENQGDRGSACNDVVIGDEWEITEFVSINDSGKIAFNSLVQRLESEPGDPAPNAMVVEWSPNSGLLNAVECALMRNGSIVVLSDGTVFPRLGQLVELSDTSGYFVHSWNSQADDGTVAFAGNYSEFHVEPDPLGGNRFVIDSYDTNLFLFRGSGSAWTQVAPLPSTCAGSVPACFGGRIEIANDHSILVNESDEHGSTEGYGGPYVLYDWSGGRQVLLRAEPGGAWQRLSRKPGFSRDGKAIAFVGDPVEGPAGLYLHVVDPAVPTLATANLLFNLTNTLALDDLGQPFGFAELSLASQPSVIHHDVGNDGNIIGDTFIVAFKGTPQRASRSNPIDPSKPLIFSAELGVWTVRVDVERELQGSSNVVLNTRGILPVAQVGDFIDGQTITNVSIWRGMGRATADPDGSPRNTTTGRPSPGDHYFAFWAMTTNGPLVLRAAHLDTDDDGLPDHWEREGGGIDIDRDGTIELALHEFGAQVRHKDIFLEIDWTAPRTNGFPGGWRNEPYPGALRRLTEAFAIAPVQNPDGTNGITLHIDAGPEMDRRGEPFSRNLPGISASLLQGGDRVRMPNGEHPDVIYFDRPSASPVPLLRTRSLHEVKEQYFGTTDKRARELAFHYCVMADWHAWEGFVPVTNDLYRTMNMDFIIDEWYGFRTPAVPIEDGDWVMIVSGRAAGQVRRLDGVYPEDDGSLSLMTFGPRYDPPLEEGAQFILLRASTGQSEIAVRGPGTGDAPDNQHSLPGNDIILSLGGQGRGSWGILGNRDIQWRTLMHELGHNFGLRHAGNEADCEYRGDVYWSLMSYSHQFRSAPGDYQLGGLYCSGYPDGDPIVDGAQSFWTNSPPVGVVMSYSDGNDPLGFNDWAYLRMDLWRTLPFVGNSMNFLNGALANIHETYPTRRDITPPNTESPIVEITIPPAGGFTPIGNPLNVSALVQHETPIEAVIVTFDINGNGATSPDEVRSATLNGAEYQVSFPAISGPAGARRLSVTAHDLEGNGSTAQASIAVGSASSDLNPPYAEFTEPQFNERVALQNPLFVEVMAFDDESSVETIWIRFDRNGDGITELILAEPVTPLLFQAIIPSLSGGVGSRTLSLIVFDRWRNAFTNSITVNVRPFDRTPPQIRLTAPNEGDEVPLGTILRVRGTVTDNLLVSRVNVIFDIDGNGTYTSSIATLSQGTNFTDDIGDVNTRLSGPIGPRMLRVEALDEANNRSVVVRTVTLVDGSPPSIQLLSPTNDAVVALNAPLTVAANISDDQAVSGASVSFDSDGDGAAEVRTATRISGARHEAAFPALQGSEGARQLVVTAWDVAGKTSVLNTVIYAARGAVIKTPLAGDVVKPSSTFQVRLAAASSITVTSLTVAFDVNGDGALTGPGETVAATPGVAPRSYLAAFANIQGPPGPRDLQVITLDSGGGSNFVTRTLTVAEFGGFAGTESIKLGAVPFLRELAGGGLAASGPERFSATPGHLFFSALDREAGRELFRTDGTAAGTLLLKDVTPDWSGDTGGIGGRGTPLASIGEMVSLNHAVYFAASDFHGSSFGSQFAHVGYELWKSDGSPDGTVLLKDIRLGGESSSPQELAVFNGRLFFAANDGIHGEELWTSDGTGIGTMLFLDIQSGETTSHSEPRQIKAVGPTLYFAANRKELWKSDGTPGGTMRVKDVRPDDPFPSDSLDQLTPCGAFLFFVANDGNGWELWRSDGTEPGTFMLRDIQTGLGTPAPAQLTPVGTNLFFVATNSAFGWELWKSDGSANGTLLVRDIVPGEFSSFPQSLVAFNGMLYFSANDGVNGDELWRSDGTAAGTVLAANIAVSTAIESIFAPYPTRSSSPRNLTVLNSTLYFSADDGLGVRGRELWQSDGTAGGTVLVKDINPIDGNSSSPEQLYAWNGALYFRASDGYNSELWRSDGTATGTYRMRNLSYSDGGRLAPAGASLLLAASDGIHGIELWKQSPGAIAMVANIAPGATNSSPTNLVAFNSQWLFGGIDPANSNRVALYLTDGASSGSRLLRSFVSFGSTLFPITPMGPIALFTASDGSSGRELWKTDGTSNGTVRVKDIWPGATDSNPNNVIIWNGAAYFAASDNLSGSELWRSDGSASGTVMLSNLNAGSASSSPRFFQPHGARLFFTAIGTGTGEEIWSTDGAPGGTLILSNIAAGSGSSVAASQGRPLTFFTLFNNELYFKASDSAAGTELWKTDGTSSGTRRVKDIYPGANSNPQYITTVGRRLFFAANSTTISIEPWISDGTTDGTMLLKNIWFRRTGESFDLASEPVDFVEVNGLAFFTAFHPTYGRELWRSDGTLAGTVLVRDIFPGERSSQIADFTVAGQQLLFTARDAQRGRELWVTDGTYEGTHPIEDLLPGPGSSMPTGVTNINDQIYYFAVDGGDDLSLRRLTPPATTPFSQWLDSVATFSGNDRLAAADPDGDGLSNISEYEFNSNPADPTSGLRLLMIQVTREGIWNNIDVTYLRRKNVSARGLIYFLQRSHEITGFLSGSAVYPQTIVSVDSQFDAVTVRIQRLASEPSHYFRLGVSSSP